MDEPDIKIPIVAEADTRGFKETGRAAKETASAVKQAAADMQQASDAAPALSPGGAPAEAAREEAERSKALSEQMVLEARTRRELQAEIQRLAAARKAAAATGDAAQYKKLTEQLARTKKAYSDMTNEANLHKTAMMSQVNAGMQFANTLGHLSAQVKSGTVDVAGLVNGVMSLGMALKAGLGPIGWVMVAIQGLQAAIELCGDKTEELQDKSLNYARKQAEVAGQLEAAGRAIADAMLAPQERAAKEEERLRENKARSDNEDLRRTQQIAQRKRDAALQALRDEGEAREAELQRQISQQAAADAAMYGEGAQKTDKLKALEEQLYQTRREYADKIRAAEAANNEAAAREAQKTAAQTQKQVQEALDATTGQLETLKKNAGEDLALVENPLIQKLLDKIDEYEADVKEGEARVKQAEAIRDEKRTGFWDRVEGAAEAYLAVGMHNLNFLLGDEESRLYYARQATKGVQKIAASNAELNNAVQIEKNSLQASQNSLEENKAELAKILKCEKDEVATRLGMLRALKEKKEKLEHTRDEQKLTLDAAKNETEAAEDAVNAAKGGAKAGKNLADTKRAAANAERERQKQAQDEAEAQRKRQEGWQEVQTRAISEQQEFVAKMLAATKEGSEEWKKWARQAKALSNKKIAEELGDLEKQYKVTGRYVEMDNRTQAAIHAADEKALQARRAALEKMKATPDVDATTLKAINNKIKETDKQLRGLHQSMRQAALEAQKSVENLKPLGQKAKVPNLQHSLVRAEKAYTELAKKAERQATKGDVKGMERTIADMRRMALAQERMTGYTGKAAEQHKEVVSKLQSIVRGTAEQEKGLTAQQKKQNEVLKTLGYEAKHKAKAAAAAKKIAEAQEKEAKADEQTAQKAQQAARLLKPAQQALQTQQTAAEVSQLRTQVQQLETAQQMLNSNIGALSGSLGKLAAAAERSAELTAQIAAASGAALDRLEKKLSSLEKQLDRISRKIR